MRELTFRELRDANVARCAESFGHAIDGWNAAEWACALAGEVGELCNLIKKRRRGERIATKDLADEIGDVMAYLDLLAAHLRIDLATATAEKFNVVSERRGAPQRLPVKP